MTPSQRNDDVENPFGLFDHVNEIVEMILMNIDLDQTANTILDKLNNSLGSIFLIYFKVDQKNKNLNFFSFSHKISPQIYKIIKNFIFDPYKIQYPLDIKGPLIIQCANTNEILTSQNLRDFFFPVFKWPRLLDKIQKSLKIANCIAVPTVLQKKVVGVFFVASKNKSFTPQAINLIKFYANILKIAFDNYQKFQKLQEKYELEREITSSLSHELKTPLAIAFNQSYLINTELSKLKQKEVKNIKATDIHDLQKDIDVIVAALQRMNDVTSNIFQLHALELQKKNPDFQEYNLKDRLPQVLEFFQKKTHEKGLSFEYTINLQAKKFYGGAQIEQIVTILLDNAIKYTRQGEITLEVTQKTTALFCKVTDTGVGIDPDKRKIIFERFYRDRNGKNENLSKVAGIGLGLYIANMIVQLLKGTITVNDNPKGQGTQFEVEIPI